eukprot:jgi/Mesen1/7981/ME000425S07182
MDFIDLDTDSDEGGADLSKEIVAKAARRSKVKDPDNTPSAKRRKKQKDGLTVEKNADTDEAIVVNGRRISLVDLEEGEISEGAKPGLQSDREEGELGEDSEKGESKEHVFQFKATRDENAGEEGKADGKGKKRKKRPNKKKNKMQKQQEGGGDAAPDLGLITGGLTSGNLLVRPGLDAPELDLQDAGIDGVALPADVLAARQLLTFHMQQ